jgi:hypothetical protein
VLIIFGKLLESAYNFLHFWFTFEHGAPLFVDLLYKLFTLAFIYYGP